MKLKKQKRNQQISDEELQRTQVLNLQSFKETARFEKMTSKKPAIILAVLGVLFIAIGLAFPTMQSLKARIEAEKNKDNIEKRVKEKPQIVEKEIHCQLKRLNNPNGTDEILDVDFLFKNDKLATSTKNYTLIKSENQKDDPAELSSYLNALQSFLIQISGYSVSVQTIEHGSITTTQVDYTLVDKSQIPGKHQSNYRFDVLHTSDSSKTDVVLSMTNIGYTCEEK